MYSVIGLAAILTLATAASIVVATIKSDDIDWQGVAIMTGAIGVFISPVIGGKVWQKKYEVRQKNNEDHS
jgi:hypothetical protein